MILLRVTVATTMILSLFGGGGGVNPVEAVTAVTSIHHGADSTPSAKQLPADVQISTFLKRGEPKT